MDASCQDVWDWEVLPDHRSFSTMSHASSKNLDEDQETEEHDLLPPSGDDDVDVHEPVEECKDIGVVPDETKSVPSVVADLMASEGEEEEEKKAFQFQSPDAKEKEAAATADADKFAQEEEEEEEDISKDDKFSQEDEEEDINNKDDGDDKARPQCVVFRVWKLKVNGIGALCSFGVAAATVCIFLIGGRLQHHHRQQEQQKIQLQFYGDDKRIQQVVQQTSRLNQAMSSVMGAGGASTRANISFGGFYDGF